MLLLLYKKSGYSLLTHQSFAAAEATDSGTQDSNIFWTWLERSPPQPGIPGTWVQLIKNPESEAELSDVNLEEEEEIMFRLGKPQKKKLVDSPLREGLSLRKK